MTAPATGLSRAQTLILDEIRLRGWTRVEFAERARLSKNTVADVTRLQGYKPSANTIVAIAETLGGDEDAWFRLWGRRR